MEYLIRPVEPADIPELLLMMAEHVAYEKATFTADGKLDKLVNAIFGEPARVFCEVVETETGLQGFVSYTYDFSTWDAAGFMYMDCLFIREKMRGQGIGAQILTKLQNIARQQGCINIQWQTPDFNDPAIRFYKRNGATGLRKVRFTYSL